VYVVGNSDIFYIYYSPFHRRYHDNLLLRSQSTLLTPFNEVHSSSRRSRYGHHGSACSFRMFSVPEKLQEKKNMVAILYRIVAVSKQD